jgi:class 3 adenylate cyclase/WD40 repeat protein
VQWNLLLHNPDVSTTEIRTFLIADIRGYTSFTQSRGDEAAARLAARFAEIMREAVESRGGEVIELRGDEALAVFVSARQALRAATDAQVVFADEVTLDPSLPLRVGMGIDAGEAVSVEGGYRGGALNLAARLCSNAKPGEVLASQGVVHLARATDGISFHDHGTFDMKGLAEPVQAVLVTQDGLDPSAIGARLDAAAAASALRPTRAELPSVMDPITPIVGREQEARALRWAWRGARRGSGRAMALVGPAGIGKTRLAAEVAALAAEDGARVIYAGCAESDDASVAAIVASAVGDRCLLVVDDADQAGPKTLDAFAQLSDALQGQPLLVVVTYQDQQASPDLVATVGRLVGETGALRLAPLDLDQVREIAALYLGSAADSFPASSLETTGGIPRKVHEFVGQWALREASRRLGDAASKTAVGRSDLRSIEAELAGSLVDLQLVEERARLFGSGTPDRGAGDEARAPFKGLASFDVDDGEWFFGRERLVAEFIARLAGASLLGVVGPSGSGKSSAVRAGLIPALRAGALPGSDSWILAVMRPGEHPLRELDRTVWAALTDDLRSKLAGADLPLRAVRDALGPGDRLVLVVDQFEEVFTACDDEAERTGFVSALTEAASDPRGNVAVVLAVRADYYGRCAENPALASLLGSNHILVGSMSPEEYRRAIEQPAIRAGLRVEPALTDALVAEVVGEPGGLPLLSTALLELWERRDGRTLRTAAYIETGGVRGAVAHLAEDVYGSLNEAQQSATRSVMLRLAGPGEGDSIVRRRVPLGEFDTAGNPDVRAVLDAFTARRLLTASEGTVEVSHEALLREWPRLQGWIEDDRAGLRIRAHLSEAAQEWEAGGEDPGELYRGTRLGSALDWTADHTMDLNELERKFLGQSRDATEREATRQRQTNRRLRGLLAGVAVLLVIALVAGLLAAVQRSNARKSAALARRQAKESLGQSVGAQGVSQPQLSRGLLLAREGVALAPSTQTEGSLLSTLLRVPQVIRTYTTPEDERPLQVALVEGGRVLAVFTNKSWIHFYDVATAGPLGTFRYQTGNPIVCCATTASGEAIAGLAPANRPFETVVIDPRTGRTTASFPQAGKLATTNAEQVFVIGLLNGGASGGTLFVPYYVGNDPTLWIQRQDASTGAIIGTTALPNTPLLAGINVTNGGSRLSLVTPQGLTQLDATTMKTVRHVAFHVPGPTAATNLDATRAAITNAANTSVSVVDLKTGAVTAAIGGPLAAVQAMQFSPGDPDLVVTAGDDGNIVEWNAADARAEHIVHLHSGRVGSIAFSSDGSGLFSSSLDGTSNEWSVAGRGGFGATFSTLAPGVDATSAPLGNPTFQVPVVAAGTTDSAFQRAGALAYEPDAPEQRLVLLVGNATGTTTSFDAAPPGYRIVSMAQSPDGRTLAVASNGGNGFEAGDVRLWDISGTPRLERTLSLAVKYPGVNAVVFADSGRELIGVTGNTNPDSGEILGGEVIGWNTGTGAFAFDPIVLEHALAHEIAVDPAGQVAAVGASTEKDTVRVLRLPSGAQTASVVIPAGIQSLALAQDGSLLVGDYSGQVERRNLRSLQPIGRPVLAGGGPLATVVASPGAHDYVTTDYDGTTRLFDLGSGHQIGSSFTPLQAQFNGVSISPDGRWMAILAGDGTASTFPLSESVWAAQACRAASRNLTLTEWRQFVGAAPYVKVCPQYPVPAA